VYKVYINLDTNILLTKQTVQISHYTKIKITYFVFIKYPHQNSLNPLKHAVFLNLILASKKKKQSVSTTRINWLMLFREIVAVHSRNHTKTVNALCGQNDETVNIKVGDTC
jgi:hypothetical protein